jgi:tetratricopeptide (TPR) repeat protein
LTLELDASFANAHWCLGGALLELGEQDAAICSLQRAVALSPDSPQPLGSLALALARGGRPEAAHDVLGRIETLCQDSSTVCWLRAIVLAGLGERAAALDALEQAHVARTPAMVWLSVHPELDALRGEPRFVALCRRMGLSAGIA